MQESPKVVKAEVVSSTRTYHIEYSPMKRVLEELEHVKDYDRGLILVTICMIESMSKELMEAKVQHKLKKHMSLYDMLIVLRDEGVIEHILWDSLDGLRKLRNLAGHLREFSLPNIEDTGLKSFKSYYLLCVLSIKEYWNSNPEIFRDAYLTKGVHVTVQ